MSRSRSSFCSAVLSSPTSLWHSTRVFFFDLFPERVVRYAASLTKAFASGFQNRLQLRRVPHQQALKIVLAVGPEYHRDRLALARHDDRPFLGCFHVLRKVCGDFFFSCHFHSSTSSPPTGSRLPSLTPMA